MYKTLITLFIFLAISCKKENVESLNSSNINEHHLVGLSIIKGTSVINGNDVPYFTISASLKNTENLKGCVFLWRRPNEQSFTKFQMNLTTLNAFNLVGSSSFTYKIEYTYTDGKVIISDEKLAS
jgi:hypothetical protein